MIEQLQALVIGPDEKLLLKLPDHGELTQDVMDELSAALREVGLEERTLVLAGEIEVTVVKDK